ncbi:DEP domain-containing protein 5, partial [Clonorchis sinensis]
TSFKLSIGRLFHSISLVDDSITLTNYRFRQEDPLRMEYTYALRVPDSLTYLPLRTVFTNDTINGLNWSYLDNYLCTRGVSDSYVLLPSLKYWRSRFMMLPIYSNETRRLQDAVKERMNTNGPRVACDVYEDYRLMNHAKFCENFVHFIESINRIRRPPSSARKPARQSTADKPDMSQRARDLSNSSAGPMADASSAAGKIRCPSTAGAVVPSGTTVSFQRFLTGLLASTSQSTSGSETNLNVGQNNATDDQTCITSIPASMNSLGSASDLPPAGNVTPIRTAHPTLVSVWSSLKASSTPLPCIVILMADSENGLPFIQAVGTTAFPERTFMSFDAVVWTMKWLSDIETVEQAVSYLQILLDAGWIRHASGNPAHAFIYGCYIYTLLLPDTKLLSPTSTDASTTPFLEAVDVTGQSTPITPSQPHFAGTPEATSGSTEWSADFQTDWAEVAFAHNACSSSRSPSHSTTDLNRCTLDTTVNHAFPSSFCPGGFLTYTNISTLCDVKSKTGYQELESVLYKSCLCDFDDPTPEGRTEWAHVLYTANFHPQCAFTIELQWLVASGARLTELVNHWHNRAGMSEFHFFPIPCHPFGHAGIFPDVDPLRCPLSIPLNVAPLLRYAAEMLPNRASSAGTLKDSPVLPPSWNGQSNYSAMVVASKLFVGYPSNQQLHLLRSFQHQLLNRFGFIRDTYDADQNPTDGTNFTMPAVTRNWTYVHCSGSIFVMIPVYRTESHIPNLPSEETSTNLTGCNTWMSAQPPPQKMDSAFSTASAPQTGRGNAADNPEYYNACFVEQLNTGFFWVWNHMLPRKRRCYLTGDECFQDAMLADFRAFMTAEDDRLVHAFEVFIGNLNSPSDDDPNESFKKQD